VIDFKTKCAFAVGSEVVVAIWALVGSADGSSQDALLDQEREEEQLPEHVIMPLILIGLSLKNKGGTVASWRGRRSRKYL